MSRHKSIDPDIERELDALEAALNGDANADPELLALVQDVRAQAPVIDGRFENELGAKVAEGFPRDPRRSPFGSFSLPAPRKLIAPLGIAAMVILTVGAIGLAARGGTAGDIQSGSSGSATESTALSDSANGAREAAPTAAMPAEKDAAGSLSANTPQNPVSATRKVERAASLTLTTSTDDVQNVADGVVRETQAAGGFVADSSVSTSETEGSAEFTLRIPTRTLDKAIAALSKLANVGSLSQDSQDITAPFVSATDRLADAERERSALLKALAGATGAGEIDSLKQRIAINRQVIASAKSEVRKLKSRADVSTVDVGISGTGERKDATGGWSIGDATNDAVEILGAIAGATIIALAVGVPIALVAALAWLLIGARIRRSRDAALDAG